MDGVVRDRSHTSIGDVAKHREIRDKKQQGKLEPTAVARMIGEETEGEDGGTFKMKKRSRGHNTYVVSRYQIFWSGIPAARRTSDSDHRTSPNRMPSTQTWCRQPTKIGSAAMKKKPLIPALAAHQVRFSRTAR